DAHAAPAAARRGFDKNGEAHLVSDLQRLGIRFDESFAAGHDGNAGLLRELAGLILVAELTHRIVRRADELDVARPADFGEVSVFRQKAVARMNRLDVADLGGTDDARD